MFKNCSAHQSCHFWFPVSCCMGMSLRNSRRLGPSHSLNIVSTGRGIGILKGISNSGYFRATQKNANMLVLAIELVKLFLNLPVHIFRCSNSYSVLHLKWQEILMLKTFCEIYSILPYIAKGHIRTQTKIFVYHMLCPSFICHTYSRNAPDSKGAISDSR